MNITMRSQKGLCSAGLTLLVLFTAIQGLSATTLNVGKCKPNSYSTIQEAIDAAPAGAKVQVCPGDYLEQVKIARAVTLQGITDNSGQMVRIFQPPSGLSINAINAYGRSVAAQVLVENSGGAVNISGVYVLNGYSNPSTDIVGIFYQNSPGTISGVTVVGQFNHGEGFGVGIWLEGGTAKPSVTVQNSWIYSTSYASIIAETIGQPNSDLFAKIANNLVYVPELDNGTGILVASGATVNISGNPVTGINKGYGIWIGPGAAGSVSHNNINLAQIGIETYADGVSITSNILSSNNTKAVDLQTTIGAVKYNFIVGANIAIEFNCKANLNVGFNTTNDAQYGLDRVPSVLNTSTNKLFLTLVGRTGC
jgi:hypothetical protein